MNDNHFPSDAANFLLPGKVGDIELCTRCPKIDKHKLIIICHPHPLYGGTMENKVVTTLMRTFIQLGFKVVRFNFRGVGKTEGKHADGIGEAEDLLSIVDWVKRVLPDDELYLAGFSFGAYVAYRVASQLPNDKKLRALLLIAPPVQYPDFATLPEPTMTWTVIQGEADEIVAPESVFKWLKTCQSSPQLIRIPETSHFFHGKLMELKNTIIKAFS